MAAWLREGRETAAGSTAKQKQDEQATRQLLSESDEVCAADVSSVAKFRSLGELGELLSRFRSAQNYHS